MPYEFIESQNRMRYSVTYGLCGYYVNIVTLYLALPFVSKNYVFDEKSKV